MRVLSSLLLAPLALVAAAPAPADSTGYIVVLKPAMGIASVEAAGATVETHTGQGSTGPAISIGGIFNAIPVNATKAAIDVVAKNPLVAYVEVDAIVTHAKAAKKKVKVKSQTESPSWGLPRLSSRTPGTTTYKYDPSAGAGTYAYVVDTGIHIEHPDFEGRATRGISFVTNQTDDGNGHGTHVAGIIGSKTYGVAKKTNLIAVKVLNDNGSGYVSSVISGIQWAVSNANSKGTIKKSVLNMSLAGPVSQALTDAANAAAAAGMFIAVAAGNSNDMVKNYSPANAKDACTVGATNPDDSRASYSNYGKALDIWAPGTGITSTWPANGTAVLSGTSMASPHIAGLAAYFLGFKAYMTPVAMCKYIRTTGTQNVITDNKSAGRILAYNGV